MAKAHLKSPNFYEAPHFLTTPSLSATCHAKLQTVNKHFLIPKYTAQLTTAADLVQKGAVLFAVGSVWGRIGFSPQTNHSRIRLKAYRDHLFKEVSVLVRCTPECDCCILTRPNEPHQEGKWTLVRFNWTKWGRCESTPNLIWVTLASFSV